MSNNPPATPEGGPPRRAPSARSERPAPPAVIIHAGRWHVQIDTLPRLPRWLVIWGATLAGSIAGLWGVAR
jgi:hypothetical protein